MKFFAAAILAATAFAVKVEQMGDQKPAKNMDKDPMDMSAEEYDAYMNMDMDMEKDNNGVMRILEAIDADQSGDICYDEACEAIWFLEDYEIIDEETADYIHNDLDEEETYELEEVADYFKDNFDEEDLAYAVEMIEDEVIYAIGGEMWEYALMDLDKDSDDMISHQEAEDALEYAVMMEWMSQEEADEFKADMDTADVIYGNGDGMVDGEEMFDFVKNDPEMRDQVLEEAFEWIEEEQDWIAEWEDCEDMDCEWDMDYDMDYDEDSDDEDWEDCEDMDCDMDYDEDSDDDWEDSEMWKDEETGDWWYYDEDLEDWIMMTTE